MIEAASTSRHASQSLHATRSLYDLTSTYFKSDPPSDDEDNTLASATAATSVATACKW